ncbi:MAG: TetR/AcrR family transcriptional regulator [Bacteroidales bacterium]|nr:TetR/AcrR family transcriptional regulator [Bacteroidales bacterium]
MNQEDKITEAKIFDAATEEFEDKGMDGARMQDIADRAGINKALLHYYFRTKDKLFMAVFDKLAEKMFKKFAGIFELDMPMNKKLEYFFTEHISFLEKNPKLPMFILREINRNPELLEKFLSKINLENIKNGIRKNIPRKDMPKDEFAHLMVSIVSLSVFPIVAKPIIEGILSKQEISYDKFIEERKQYSPRFIQSAISGMAENPNNPKSN